MSNRKVLINIFCCLFSSKRKQKKNSMIEFSVKYKGEEKLTKKMEIFFHFFFKDSKRFWKKELHWISKENYQLFKWRIKRNEELILLSSFHFLSFFDLFFLLCNFALKSCNNLPAFQPLFFGLTVSCEICNVMFCGVSFFFFLFNREILVIGWTSRRIKIIC